MTKKDESKIPKGCYCYDQNGVCPYWSKDENKPHQRNGYCSFLERGDWEVTNPELPEALQSAASLLWDQCKECGINDEIDMDAYTTKNIKVIESIDLSSDEEDNK